VKRKRDEPQKTQGTQRGKKRNFAERRKNTEEGKRLERRVFDRINRMNKIKNENAGIYREEGNGRHGKKEFGHETG
jgi:hypothetical protein